jgi:hypothetical protein
MGPGRNHSGVLPLAALERPDPYSDDGGEQTKAGEALALSIQIDLPIG